MALPASASPSAPAPSRLAAWSAIESAVDRWVSYGALGLGVVAAASAMWLVV